MSILESNPAFPEMESQLFPALTAEPVTSLAEEIAISQAERVINFLQDVDSSRETSMYTEFFVNYPGRPEGTEAHQRFIELMKFESASYVEDSCDQVYDGSDGVISRQVINVHKTGSDMPADAAFVNYWIVRAKK